MCFRYFHLSRFAVCFQPVRVEDFTCFQHICFANPRRAFKPFPVYFRPIPVDHFNYFFRVFSQSVSSVGAAAERPAAVLARAWWRIIDA